MEEVLSLSSYIDERHPSYVLARKLIMAKRWSCLAQKPATPNAANGPVTAVVLQARENKYL
jgi:hypothetical protein